MDRMTDELAGLLPLLIGMAIVQLYVFGGYLAILIDRGRPDSPSKDDRQVGLKLVLIGLLLFGLVTAINGAERIVAMMLGGFHDFVPVVKTSIVGVLVGGGVAAVIGFVVLPRTNLATARQPERFALGLLSVVYGVVAIFALSATLGDVIQSAAWAETSSSLALAAVTGAVAFLALGRFGARSGWTPPPVAMPPMQQQPPPGLGGGGYPPPQGPQGGGYYGPPPGGNPYQPR